MGVVELEFDTGEGSLCLPLDRCVAFPFELDCLPVRDFPSYRGQRNFPGLWWFSHTAVYAGHESWLERDQLMALDADPDVIGIVSQPFWFRWHDGVSHAPDYFARRRDGSVLVADVRDDDRIASADQEKFDRSAAECWDYRSVDERVVAAVRDAIDGETDLSTATVQRMQRKDSKALVAAYGPDYARAMPSQPTFYRLVKRLAEGRYTFGSARTRRSLSKQPDGPFGAISGTAG